MKITADMVGKRVKHFTNPLLGRVIAVHDGYFWVETAPGCFFTGSGDFWELAPEPPKKPSERIRELAAERHSGAIMGFTAIDSAFMAYLDELREQGKI